MKRALLVVLLVFLACSIAFASSSTWRFNIKPDDGSGLYSAGNFQAGCTTDASDGSDALDLKFPWQSIDARDKAVASNIGTANVLCRDIKNTSCVEISYTLAPGTVIQLGKVWDLRVAGLTEADIATPIGLRWFTVSSAALPATGCYNNPGWMVHYWLKMVDNKGAGGAPPNGTVWSIPIPTAHSTNAYFTLSVPTIRLSANDDAHMLSEGYQLHFIEECFVPEPSSMLALGAGLIALAGFARRRRR